MTQRGNPNMAEVGKWAGKRGRKTTKYISQFKKDIMNVYERMGGVDNMECWARKNPDHFYKYVFGLLPREIVAEIKHGRSISEYSAEEIIDIIAGERASDTAQIGDGEADPFHDADEPDVPTSSPSRTDSSEAGTG